MYQTETDFRRDIMLVVMEILIGVIAVIFFGLGVVILRKKPVFINGYLMTAILGICYLPVAAGQFIRPILRGDFDFGRDWIGLLFVAFFILLIFVYKKSFGDYLIYNVEEELLYESIFTALKEQGIEYEDKRGKIILPALGGEIKISIHSIFKTANLHLRFKEKKEISSNLIQRLKNILSEKKMKKVPLSGIVYIACSIFLMMVAVFLFID